MRNNILVLGFVALAFLAPALSAHAQVGITLYPVSFRIQIDPGKTWQGVVTVMNPNPDRLGVQVEKENLSGGAEGSIQLQGEEANSIGLASWITVDRASDVLQPNEKKEFTVTIAVPENAPPGGHYAAVLFRGISSDAISGTRTGVGIAGRVGTVILVEVSGEVERAGSLVAVDAPRFQSRGPVEVSFKVANTGNSYFSPEGKVVFQNLWRRYEATWEPRVVFPGFDRTFKASWQKEYFIGPVSATVMADIPGGGALPIKTVTVWMFPWQEALVVLGIGVVFGFGMRFVSKRFKIVRVTDADKQGIEHHG